jgi:parallel beta-helix repeat protein
MKNHPFAFVISLLTINAFPILAQGPLTPPGAPASLMKTLEQVEPRTPISSVPFTIIRPGSYYLTTNLTGAGNGIVINSSDVVVDLNGFVLRGGAGSGISVPAAASNIWVRNGVVREWGGFGISNNVASASGVENVTVISSGQEGIRLGLSATVRDCTVLFSGNTAIRVGTESRVEGCTVSSNFAGQIIDLGARSRISHCIVARNSGDGINTADGCYVLNCTSSSNGRGIFLGNNCVVENCIVQGNTSIGIRTFNFNTVRNCKALSNGGDGIFAVTHNVLIDNVCHGNGTGALGGAGIRMAGGPGTRIEGNSVHLNGWGIRVESTNNIIIRNFASLNDTNYFIVTSNRVGTIVAAPFSGAISGNTGGAGVGTTDPWANLSF